MEAISLENIVNSSWEYFKTEATLDPSKVGKWMVFFDFLNSRENIRNYCREAVEKGIVTSSKLSNRPNPAGQGVSCFYLEIDDYEGHKKIIKFLMHHNLIRKTKNNEKFYNMSFKLDSQTKNNEYKEGFASKLTLDELIDLKTGDWIR